MTKLGFTTTVLGFLLTSAIAGWAQTGDGGGTGLAFLKVGVGARASAMGEAYTAVSDDATATFWNPAALALLEQPQVAFTHTEWIQDITAEYFAFVSQAFGGGIGLSINANDIGGIERRVKPSAEPLATVGANDVSVGVSFARKLSPHLAAGVTLKYLYEKIFIESSSGYAFDAGLSYRSGNLPVRLAVVLQNVGSMGNLRNEAIELPLTVRGGIAYQHALSSLGTLVLAADAVKVKESDLRGNFGAELWLKSRLAVRLGYQTGFDDRALNGGFGLQFARYHFDYGFTPFDSNFGDTHRISFRLDL